MYLASGENEGPKAGPGIQIAQKAALVWVSRGDEGQGRKWDRDLRLVQAFLKGREEKEGNEGWEKQA